MVMRINEPHAGYSNKTYLNWDAENELRIFLGEKLEKNKRMKGLDFRDSKKLSHDSDTIIVVLDPLLLSNSVFLSYIILECILESRNQVAAIISR